MTSAATKKTTTKSSGQNGQTLTEMEQAQQELQQKIEAQREKEQERAWQVLSEALPKAAQREQFNGQAVKDSLEAVGLDFEQFKSDAASYRSATEPRDDDELSKWDDDHELSEHIKNLRLNAEENLQRAKQEQARLRGLVMQRGSRRQTLRTLRGKGYAIDVR